MMWCLSLPLLVSGVLTQPSGVLTPSLQDAQDAASEDPMAEGVAAVVNGVAIEEQAFRDWLLRTRGWAYLDDYVGLTLMRQEAERSGIRITDADVDAALEQDWKDNVLMRYGGDESRFLDKLRGDGMTREGYLARKRFTMEHEVLARKIVLARRTITTEELQKLYAEEFPDERRRHVQVAFFDVFRRLQPIRTPTPDLLERTRADTRARAEAFLADVQADPNSFASRLLEQTDPALVSRYDSFVNDLREVGGEIRRYRQGLLSGDPLDELLARDDLVEGQCYGPIETTGGFFVVRVVSLAAVTFAEVESELLALFRTRPATAREIHYLRMTLTEQAEVRKAPRYNVD